MSTYWEMWFTTEGQGIEFEDVPDDSKDQWREPCDSRATTPTRGEQLTTAEVSPQVVIPAGSASTVAWNRGTAIHAKHAARAGRTTNAAAKTMGIIAMPA